MHKLTFLFFTFSLSLFLSCNNAKDHEGHNNKDESGVADSLYNQLIDEHNVGMKDWMKIETRKNQINKILDSLRTLPGKASAGMDELKNKLNDAASRLQTAYDDMDSWMSSMNLDSAKNDIKQRIKYLTEENQRAKQVNDAITRSLQKADSLIKAKF